MASTGQNVLFYGSMLLLAVGGNLVISSLDDESDAKEMDKTMKAIVDQGKFTIDTAYMMNGQDMLGVKYDTAYKIPVSAFEKYNP